MNAIPPPPPVSLTVASPVGPMIDPAREYRSPRRWATLLRWSLVGCVVAAAVSTAAGVAEYRLIGRLLAAPTSVSLAELEAADDRRVALSIAVIVLSVASYVLLAAWTSRLYRNLASLRIRGLRFTEGWAVGAWFVPLLNLVRPKQILNDIWRASEPDADGDGWHQNRVSPLLHWWWAMWLGSWVLYRSMNVSTNDPAAVRERLVTEVMAATLLALSAVLALIVVRRLTDRQTEQAATRTPVPLTGTVGAPVQASGRFRSGSLVEWLAPIIGIVALAAALLLFDLPEDSADGSTRAERANDGSVASRGGVLVNDLQVGDCFNDPAALTAAPPGEVVDVVGIEVLPCDELHDSEVYALLQHPGASSADFPGEAEVTEYAADQCVERFEPWVGISFEESILDVDFFMPHAEGWSAGDRGIICAAHRIDSQQLDAPVRDAGI